MRARTRFLRPFAAVVTLWLAAAVVLGDPPDGSQPQAGDGVSDESSETETRYSVPAARERAKLMHNVFEATLDVIHHRYFRDDRAMVPARALEDVFLEVQRLENIKARWISVNARAMSIDHEPQDDFEKAAAQAIREGKGEFELVAEGSLRRAGAIPLGAGCLSCHASFGGGAFGGGTSKQSKRFAALVITIPVEEQ